MKKQTLTVEQFYKDNSRVLGLRLIAGESGLKRIIREPTVNRPGLVLAGFTKYFARHRIQVIGAAEATFLKTLTPQEREKRYRLVLSFKVPCLVFGRSIQPDRLFLQMAEDADIAVFSCPLITMKFINLATIALENLFALRGTEMGSMVDILGVGVIIKGESGIGKSECVLALIERGYSLVSDDITRVALQDGKDVMGTSAELTRNLMEVRGIGIINVAMMFGVKSIRAEKRVDLVVSLRGWSEVPDVDRLGLEDEYVLILGTKVPHITIPVRPGRDIARLVEVAAFQTKLKASGHNPARELNDRLIAQMNDNRPA
ncbi:MAG: HPr(Ser) kinase/phosphatase [Verrucomicrobia bacterium]|nr:HPr(Ser) kinase/phosphatase [Verrucomicrobiota bacterium]MBI3868214.1 HPr(Ser) kinase/phosphatase [Verrucomicrobiota bacterium]